MQPEKDPQLKITGDTRLNKVLDSVPGALEYIISINPEDFNRLKNPVLRRYMSPRISLRRVAAMARVSEAGFLEHLRALNGGHAGEAGESSRAQSRPVPMPQSPQSPPAWFADVVASRIHWVDLLPIDDVQGDPMLPVTVAVRQMQPGETIGVRHRWEPQPLYDIWQKLGLQWYARHVAAGEWNVFVHKPAGSRPSVPLAGSRSILVEVRHLPEQEAPARVLVAFEQLKPRGSLEIWVEPGATERALSALRAKHTGEFKWARQESAPDRETIQITRLPAPNHAEAGEQKELEV